MKKLLFILEKEFKQILRDKLIMIIILIVPILQMLILPMAADMDVRHLKLAVVDQDQSSISRRLVNKISSSNVFDIIDVSFDYESTLKKIEKDEIDIIITIPQNFENKLIKENKQKVAISASAINTMKAGLGTSYLRQIINDYNLELISEYSSQNLSRAMIIQTTSSALFNKFEDFKYYMVPAILVLLLTVVSAFLTALNIVKEKEIGTIEQINVTPIKKWEFIVGKLIPFWIISLVVFTIALLIMRFVYGIEIEGSLSTLYFFTNIYIFATLGLGLLVSTFAQTQQQSMFISYFFIMIFILMSGLFMSISSMPLWAKVIANLIPITHYMEAVRAIILKGSGIMDLYRLAIYIIIMGVVLVGLAIRNYRKTS